MKYLFVIVGMIGVFIIAETGYGQPAEKPKPDSTAKPKTRDEARPKIGLEEKAIRAAIDSYVEAFNQANASALTSHWTKQGEMVTPAGKTFRGHEQLKKGFSKYFTENKGAKLELLATEIELVSPSVAVETGYARVIAPDQEPSETEYKAVHVATDGGWKIDSVREQLPEEVSPSNYELLQPLQWMLGTWVNSDESRSIETTCRWTTNRNFLVRTFRVNVEGQIDMEGTQIIGWDPHSQAIRSWLFDSDGGFGVGRWSQNGDRWTVQSLHVLPGGQRASSTNIYDVIDQDKIRFSSIGRQVDGELLPSVDPVMIIRNSDN